jgi:lipopolysaccharide transport system permease protein
MHEHNGHVYLPPGMRRRGLDVWREMVRELVDSQELTWRFYLRDFSVRYRQSILGYVWAIGPLLASAATFAWLNRTHILAIHRTGLPYPVFVLLSMAVWQLFAGGLTAATQSLVAAGSLITKINFPRETLVLAAFGQSIFEFALRWLLVIAAFVLTRTLPAWTIVLIPVCLLPLCLFTLGLGFLFALMNGVLRDAGQIVGLLLTVWMFLTPVVYPPPVSGLSIPVCFLNPVSPFVVAAQDLAGKGYLVQPGGFAIGCAVSLVVFLLGWRLFHLTESRIAERV